MLKSCAFCTVRRSNENESALAASPPRAACLAQNRFFQILGHVILGLVVHRHLVMFVAFFVRAGDCHVN